MDNEDSEKHHPAQTGYVSDKIDVDLGDGVGITWTTWKGERVGGILSHMVGDKKCEGAFNIRGNAFHARANLSEHEKKAPQWDFDGNWERPTLNPSFLCHCGFHGWVRQGRWVNA